MGLRVQYVWRELTNEGLLLPFKLKESGDYGITHCDRMYDSEQEAIDDFCESLGDSAYISCDCVIIKVYGWV